MPCVAAEGGGELWFFGKPFDVECELTPKSGGDAGWLALEARVGSSAGW